MAIQATGLSDISDSFAASLLGLSLVAERAQLTVAEIVRAQPDVLAAVVYVIRGEGSASWVPQASAGEVEVRAAEVEQYAGTLGTLAEAGEELVFAAADLSREDYAHLDIRRTFTALAYFPLLSRGELIGAIEVISFQEPLGHADAARVREISRLAGPALGSALSYEAERNSSLQSITRVTQMYDLEKVFNSNLELDDLLDSIASKVQELLAVEAVNLWMVDGDDLKLSAQKGQDASAQVGAVQGPGSGPASTVADSGELICIGDGSDERLRARNQARGEAGIFSLLAAPLMDRESLVGVVEAVNRLDGAAFDEDDEFLLSNICETANNALHNASLLLAERKVEILEALVKVSGEITSTLDLDRVLDAVVNGAATVIPFERAAIALDQRGHLQVRAVTGMPRVNPQDPAVVRLKEVLEWASLSREPILATQHEDEVDDPRPETRAKFDKYFGESGMRAFYALPLTDDDGNLGVLSFESSNSDFLSPAHLEMIQVLGGQATVALRNASLYREVPFISVLEPVLQRKRKFLALEKRRRALMLAAGAAVLLLLVVVPFPLRVSGDAVVAPSHSARVQPELPGIVTRVEAREGELVHAGQVLATLSDWQYRASVAEAEAKYNAAVSSMNSALAHNDGREAGMQRVQADYWSSELQRSRERLGRTVLRSPLDGIVATPRLEDLVGKSLQPGDTLAEVVDTSTATIDVAIAEADANLLRAGESASVKLEGFPTHTLRGRVTVVSPRTEVLDGERYFYARVAVRNPDGRIRPGMQGRGKILIGWTPAGRVLFRRPAMWTWEKLWAWMGW